MMLWVGLVLHLWIGVPVVWMTTELNFDNAARNGKMMDRGQD